MFYNTSIAQREVNKLYYTKLWAPTVKDSAYYYSIYYQSDNHYYKKDYYAKTDAVYMVGNFIDKDFKTKQGDFKWYYESGKLRDSILFDNGEKTTSWHYYEDGKTRAVVSFKNGKITEQKGWDETGKEIADFIFEREARFPGGQEGWKRYLERNLNANAAANDGAPIGQYSVKVQFTIDKEGKVQMVKAVIVPLNCPSCGLEAVRIIERGPRWEPAVLFSKPAFFQVVEYITFQVSGY